MAAPLRPFISIDNNQRAVYHSVDAIDQGAYDALTHQYHRNAFIEVVRRWLVEIVEGGRWFQRFEGVKLIKTSWRQTNDWSASRSKMEQ